jgi:hypothetical protein
MQEQKLVNLKLYVNVNGWGAYKKIDPQRITAMLRPYEHDLDITVILTDCTDFPFLRGLDAHYVTLDDELAKQAGELVKE